MQTVAGMRGVGVKNREKIADVLCGRPLIEKLVLSQLTYFYIEFLLWYIVSPY